MSERVTILELIDDQLDDAAGLGESRGTGAGRVHGRGIA